MLKPHLIALAALALGLLSAPVMAADPAAAGGDPVVARVNGQEIHRSDVLRELQLMGPQAEKMPMQMLYPELLQKMIATKIVAAKGYEEKLQNDPEAKSELKDAEAQIVAQLYVRKAVQPKVTDAKIKERYDQLSAKFKPEDEVRASHILFTGPNADQEAQDAIKQLKGERRFRPRWQKRNREDTGSLQARRRSRLFHARCDGKRVCRCRLSP